jgi:membrane-associated phospholipid phosphatase
VDLSVKHALRWDNHTKAADVSSYVTGFALAPLAAYGLDAAVVLGSGGSAKEWAVDALVITESIVVAADINQLVKFSVGRERPFVHDLSPAEKLTKPSQPSDNNLSFFSGHTTLGFSAAVSAGMVATLRGYKAAPYIWATGMTLAVATGYLRIAADKHYFTDVMTGALWGTVAGVVVPLLHRPCTASGPCVKNVSSGPMPGGASFGFSGVW